MKYIVAYSVIFELTQHQMITNAELAALMFSAIASIMFGSGLFFFKTFNKLRKKSKGTPKEKGLIFITCIYAFLIAMSLVIAYIGIYPQVIECIEASNNNYYTYIGIPTDITRYIGHGNSTSLRDKAKYALGIYKITIDTSGKHLGITTSSYIPFKTNTKYKITYLSAPYSLTGGDAMKVEELADK